MDWKSAWSYLPVHYGTVIGVVEDITQRTVFWNNLNGDKIRICFSNLYGNHTLVLDKTVIAQKKSGSDALTEQRIVTCEGKEKIEIPAGTEFYSDELDWKMEAGTEIVVSIYLKHKMEIESACSTWSAVSWHTVYGIDGDHTMEQEFPEKQSREIYPYVEADANKADILVGIREIQILTEEHVKTLTLFGDSITHMSYFSDALMEKLYRQEKGKITVVNCGIGGNRILHDAAFAEELPGQGCCFGDAGEGRFEKDVYKNGTPEDIILLEGVNDMMHPEFFGLPDESVTAKDLAQAAENLINMAHKKGSRIWLGTVMPFHHDQQPLCPNGEKVWAEYNTWIRQQNLADGVIDFAKVVEDPDRVECMREGLHIGDGLHPGKEGGKLMAEEALKVLGY